MSEVLRAIASSPHDLQPVFETILDSATRLCRVESAALRLSEEGGARRVAQRLAPDAAARWTGPPTLAPRGTFLGDLATRKTALHIPDIAQHESYLRGDPTVVAGVDLAGLRTQLSVPLLKDDHVIGYIGLARRRRQPFTDREIALVTDFARQATIALDITRRERELRKVQSELARANRVAILGQLAASIAHELRQPLTSLAANGDAGLNWLAMQPPNLGQAKRSFEAIVADSRRANSIVNGLMGLTKKKAPRKECLDINHAIMEVAALIQSEALKNGVSIDTRLAPRLPPLRGDRVQLQQVILNLTVNAIQAMSSLSGSKRELEISTERTENGVRVACRDTGPGLTPESLDRLFEPFYTTRPDGVGLGLSICRSIVQAHGGRLWATAAEPNGALFQFTIPADQGPGADQEP
ncbi:ATP-binding protein [Bradyrhizobium sp. ARR65]|uniref:sensor histidine kinase n=1 Tax=Bradyrhizobium sp. ARR65 TaxID=1040989 RepID=UPI0018DD3582|nr:ATP-binding protein [Bradyrhizobium sp. ARR65]